MPPELDTDTLTDGAADTSIRGGLEAAFAEAESAAPPPAPAAPSPSPTPAPQPTSAPAPADSTAAGTDEPPAPPAPTERAIPERLKSRFGEKWATIPPEIRDTFHEYETNIGRLASTYGQRAKQWEEAQKVYAPYAEMVAKEGGNFHSAVANLLETSRILRQGTPEQKIVLLRQTAAAFNIPLEALSAGGAPAGEAGAPAAPPINEELINRLNTLERTVLTTRGTEAHNARTQVETEIQTFMSDPANVYLQEPGYLDTMSALIGAGKANDLPEAYRQAAWLHERPRQLEIAKANQQREQAGRETAARARRAASSVNGSAPGTVKPDPNKMSLRDTLSAAYDGELE